MQPTLASFKRGYENQLCPTFIFTVLVQRLPVSKAVGLSTLEYYLPVDPIQIRPEDPHLFEFVYEEQLWSFLFMPGPFVLTFSFVDSVTAIK